MIAEAPGRQRPQTMEDVTSQETNSKEEEWGEGHSGIFPRTREIIIDYIEFS
jgi:hypothetical protein